MRSRCPWLMWTLLLAAATMPACDSKRFDRAAPGAECIGYDRERCVGNDVYRCDDTSGKRSVMGLLTGKGAHWVLRQPCPPATSRCVEATDASGLEERAAGGCASTGLVGVLQRVQRHMSEK